MSNPKDEFKAAIRHQLDDLHDRIEELAALTGRPHEHAISYETVVSEARRKHRETMQRLHLLDEHGDAWTTEGERVRRAIRELDETIRTKAGGTS